MFPIGDSPNPRGIAWVTYVLIAINVLVFVLYLPAMSEVADPGDPRVREYTDMIAKETGAPQAELEAAARRVTEYDLVVYEHGSRPVAPSWLDMLTSMFLHGGFMHLFGNMLFLWIYGNNAESRIGRIPYLLAYLATGYAAAFGDILLRPESGIPAVGASGAISGVLGMYFIWFPHNKVRLLILIPPLIRQVELGARWVLGFYIVVQNLLPAFLTGGGPGGVAHGAHIGGFVAGVLLALGTNLLVRLGWGRRTEHADEPDPQQTLDGARKEEGGLLGAFREAMRAGDVDRASTLLLGAPRDLVHAGLGPAETVALGDALARAREPRRAAAAYDVALRQHARGEDAAAAHLGAARVLLEDLKQPTAAYQHVVDAVKAGATPSQQAEARALLQEMRRSVKTLPNAAARW